MILVPLSLCFILLIFLFFVLKSLYGNDKPFIERNSTIPSHSNRSPTPRISQVHRAFPSLHKNKNKPVNSKKWPIMHFNTKTKNNNNSTLSASENTESGYTLPQVLPVFNKSLNRDIPLEQPKPYFASNYNFPKNINQSSQSVSTGFSQSSGFHYNIPGYDDTYTVTAPSGYQFINQPSKKKHRSQNKTDDKKHSKHERSHKSRSNDSEEGSKRKRRSEGDESEPSNRSKREFDQEGRNSRSSRGQDRNSRRFVKGENEEDQRSHNNDSRHNDEQGSFGNNNFGTFGNNNFNRFGNNNFNSFGNNNFNSFGNNNFGTFGNNNFNSFGNNNFGTFNNNDVPIVPVTFED